MFVVDSNLFPFSTHHITTMAASEDEPSLNMAENTQTIEQNSACPSLSLELWDIVIQHLLDDGFPRALVNLTRVSRLLHERTTPMIYHSVWLRHPDENALFARTMGERPDLAAPVKTVQHDWEAGFFSPKKSSQDLYRALINLPNLKTMSLRKRYDFEHADLTAMANAESKLVHDFYYLNFCDFHGADGSVQNEYASNVVLGSPLFYQAYLQHPTGLPALRYCEYSLPSVSGSSNTAQATLAVS